MKWAVLPIGWMYCRLALVPYQELRGSGGNLSKYFYRLKNPPPSRSRNCFGRRICGEEAAKLGGRADSNYRLALRVVGMGDHNVVDIDQQCHIDVLRRTAAPDGIVLMEYGAPLPDILAGLYIDDLIAGYIYNKSSRLPNQAN